MLIAPIYKKGATSRSVYLPGGDWYDWWTNSKQAGGKTIFRNIDLATMPIYVRAGSIIPMDPIRQYADEKIKGPLTIRIYSGADGNYTFYDDDGKSQDYLKGKYSLTYFNWNDKERQLTIGSVAGTEALTKYRKQVLRIELLPDGITREVNWKNNKTVVSF
jgi:alpha-glucosidase/alpha-D-xyloside xylohydrolase